MHTAPTPGISSALRRRVILGGAAVIAALGLAAELAHHLGGVESSLVSLLSLSYEGNLPTWYASTLLSACALALAAVAAAIRQAGARARPWSALAAIFLYISLDESVGFHEDLSPLIELPGVLYFGWVVPAAGVVTVLGLAYVPFLVRLPAPTRRRFVVAGAMYVTGALLLELPLGWWTERAGDDNLVYALIDFVEESLELFGASLFLLAVLDHLDRVRAGDIQP